MSNDDSVQDAEIVTSDIEGAVVIDNGKVTQSNVDLTSLINRYVADIEKTKAQLKEQNQMFKDAFENDKEYHDKNEVVKAATKEKNAVKQRIMQQPAIQSAAEKVQDLKSELKDMQEALSGYLQEHIRKTGQRTIETDDGELREIVPVYKLVKRRD